MSDDDEIGYGKPPKASQFKPGQSGNPMGRPKGARNISTLVDDELNSKILIREGTKSYKIRKLDAIVKTMVNLALKGDVRALKWIEGHRSEEPFAALGKSRKEVEKEVLDTLNFLDEAHQHEIMEHRGQLKRFGVPEDLIIEATGLDVEEQRQRKKCIRKDLLKRGIEPPLIDEILGPEDDNEDGETATSTPG